MRCAEGLRNTHGLSGFRALFSASSETRGSGPNALLVWLHATALCPYPEVLRRGPKPELPTLQSCSKATASKGATTTAASRLRWGRAHILPGSAKAKGKGCGHVRSFVVVSQTFRGMKLSWMEALIV